MRTYRYGSRGTARGLRQVCALALLLLAGSSLQAQERRYLVELGAGAVYQTFAEVSDLGSTVGYLGRIGLWLPAHFSVEGEASTVPAKTDPGDVDVGLRTFSASLLYNMPLGKKSWAHLRVGLGKARYGDPPCPTVSSRLICGNSGTFMTGAGVRVGLASDLMARGDLLLSWNKSQLDPDDPNDDVVLTNFGVAIGLSYMLGSKPIGDSDADGVLENKDRCPETPTGAQVDGNGCPSDSDGDGVPDGVDRCANTSPGAAVNATGCTQDSDGDNIADGLDRCPDTEAGVLVDPSGCPKDSDGDSIPDGLDRCSETPRGATVDALGCPGDEDGDGVLDGLDRCPRTTTGATINATGCPTGAAPAPQRPSPQRPAAPRTQRAAPDAAAGAPQPAARPRGQLAAGVIPGVGFAQGTARIRPESFVALDSIAEILKADTAARIEIGAHTDNTGTPSQDQHLTNLQADAVRTYLVTKGVNFQQVQARGYGSTFPLTPDNTPRGRVANRRIELKPAQTGP
jgi:outer membrane protein OmpA-like peptidoglycan-associated protein